MKNEIKKLYRDEDSVFIDAYYSIDEGNYVLDIYSPVHVVLGQE